MALALAVVLVGLAAALLSRGGPREHLLATYDVQSRDGDSAVLLSPHSVTRTAADIRSAWQPAQELTDPGGVFLRYSDLVVAVTPRAEGGSTVYVDDEDRGYTRWFPYVGGWWGTGSPVDGTRGGGPGAGK